MNDLQYSKWRNINKRDNNSQNINQKQHSRFMLQDITETTFTTVIESSFIRLKVTSPNNELYIESTFSLKSQNHNNKLYYKAKQKLRPLKIILQVFQTTKTIDSTGPTRHSRQHHQLCLNRCSKSSLQWMFYL